jgi:hypothetical protein
MIRERNSSGCLHSSIALHPKLPDDSEQALDLFPNHRDFSYRGDFGGVMIPTPFAQVSEAARKIRPGYSWTPHLYQEQPESM